MSIQSRPYLIVLGIVFTCLTNARSQDKIPVKFGKVTPQDFAVTAAGLDSSADAVVVADFGSSEFLGDSKGWFTDQADEGELQTRRLCHVAGFLWLCG